MRKILTILPFIFLLACLAPVAGFEPPADPAPTKTAIHPEPPLPTPVRSATCATVNTDSLHVRYQPDEHAQAMGWVTEGTMVKILTGGLWPKINGAGIDDQGRRARMTGYVNADYLTETECEP